VEGGVGGDDGGGEAEVGPEFFGFGVADDVSEVDLCGAVLLEPGEEGAGEGCGCALSAVGWVDVDAVDVADGGGGEVGDVAVDVGDGG
jgi:hypothetical protein